MPIDLPNNGYTVLSPAQNLQVIAIQNCLCSMAVLCTLMKLLIDLQILGYELHKNAKTKRVKTVHRTVNYCTALRETTMR